MLTLSSALDRTLRLYGARPAILDDERDFTWAEFGDRVARAAGVLRDRGLEPGERFAILCRNSFRQAELLNAGYRLGVVPVPLNFRLAPPEIRYILDDSDCKFLAVEDVFLRLLEAEELAPWRKRAVLIAPETGKSGLDLYDDLLAKAEPAPAHEVGEEDDAILLYTGGTTGRGKGVRLSHRNVIANGMQVALAMGVRADDVYLHAPPMFHSADLLGTAFTLVGAAHSYLPQFTGKAALESIQRHKITIAMLTPTMIIVILQEPGFGAFDISSFRLLFYGSSPMAVEWIARAMEGFSGAELQQGYGLTECAPILTTLDAAEHREALRTGETDILKAAGRPIVGVDLRIVDDQGNEVATGEGGEVVVRGPNVTAGYLGLGEENEKAFRGGWFHTGDVGRVDERGYMFLLDRKKDVIITGGENVYSSEVEAVLYRHPGVHEAAVVGVPDERYGEALFAVIVPAPEADLTEKDLIAHCRDKIGGYKIPRKMAFVEEMPKSAMGKILKTELRRVYGAESGKKTKAS